MALHYTRTKWWKIAPQWVRDALDGESVCLPEWIEPRTERSHRSRLTRLAYFLHCSIKERGAKDLVNTWGQIRFFVERMSGQTIICPRCQSNFADFSRHKPHPLKGVRGATAMFICDRCWRRAKSRDYIAWLCERDRHYSWEKTWSDAYDVLCKIRGAKDCLSRMESDWAAGNDMDVVLASLRTAPGLSGHKVRKSKYEERYSDKAVRAAASYLLARTTGERNPPALLSGVERGVRKDAKGKTASPDFMGEGGKQAAH